MPKEPKTPKNAQIVHRFRLYPSEEQKQILAQICSLCFHKHTNLTLRDRKWKCEGCGSLHDRDVNAARVIRLLALNKLNLAQGNCVNAWIESRKTADRLKLDPQSGNASNGEATNRKKNQVRDLVRRKGITPNPQRPMTQESTQMSRQLITK